MGFSKAPDGTRRSFVPWSFLQVKEVLPCPGGDMAQGGGHSSPGSLKLGASGEGRDCAKGAASG